ncbi:MAG: HAD family hydrolase [Lachnospiraceae bacterium]
MNQKLIFFDIDGTLIPERSKQIVDSAKKAIETAQKNGHICVINTGRTQKLLGPDVTDQVAFDGIVMGCGTRIVYHGKELFHQKIEADLAKKIMAELRACHIDAIFEGTENNYEQELSEIHSKEFYDFTVHFAEKKYAKWKDSIGNFEKFYAYVSEKKQMEQFQARLGEELDVIDRENGYYEIVPRGISKASGMRMLAEKLGIAMEDTVAIGDSTNDLTMLEAAGTSIAMGNSTKQLLDMADYVTTDILDDGIANALQWLGVLTQQAQ